jgi:hypothetical protein
MTEDPDLPPWAQKKPPPPHPEGRPTWVLVLALAMLVFGGLLLISGARQLAEPGGQRGLDPNASVQVTQDVKAVNEALARAYSEHPTAVRVNALSKVVMGLLMLFAVAAVFASDPRARKATMLAGWLGIAHQVGDLIFMLRIFRKGVVAGAPALVSLAARQSSAGNAPTASAVISAFDVFIVGLGALGILFSVVLLTFFGGRRGRTFFGVGADIVGRQPHHGG